MPWPKPGQALFVGDAPDWKHNAWLPPEPDWVGYTRGYELAVDVLVEHVITKDRDQDFLIYPLLFLGRHAVELGIKDVILLARQLLDQEGKGFPGTHELDHLWCLARALLEDLEEPPEAEDLDVVTEYVAQLAENDRQSFTFRYPVERDGRTPSYPLVVGDYVPALGERVHKARLINVRHFASALRELLAFFSACSQQLKVLLDYQADERRYYEP